MPYKTGYNTFSDDKVNAEYEQLVTVIPHYHELQQCMAERIALHLQDHQGPIRMIDIGCGTGISSERIINTLSDNARLHIDAIDTEDTMINQYHKKILPYVGEKNPNLSYHAHRKTIQQFFDENPNLCVDVIFSGRCIHNMQDGERALLYKSIHKSLAPNGLFINIDKIVSRDLDAHADHLMWQIKQFNLLTNEQLRDERTRHYLIDEQPGRIMLEERTTFDLLHAGFENENITFTNHYQLEEMCAARKTANSTD